MDFNTEKSVGFACIEIFCMINHIQMITNLQKPLHTYNVISLTVDPWADVKNGFTWKIIIVLKVRGGNGELKFS